MADFSWSTAENRQACLDYWADTIKRIHLFYNEIISQGKSLDKKAIDRMIDSIMPFSLLNGCSALTVTPCHILRQLEGVDKLSSEICKKYDCPFVIWCFKYLRQYIHLANCLLYLVKEEGHYANSLAPEESRLARCSTLCSRYEECEKVKFENKYKLCIEELKDVFDNLLSSAEKQGLTFRAEEGH